MIVNKELIEEWELGKRLEDFFIRRFPNGIDADSLIRRNHIPLPILRRLYDYGISNENKLILNKKLSICNCENVYRSCECSNSDRLFDCDYVKNSHFITDSSEITNSVNVTRSHIVKDSDNIYQSSFVNNCSKIINSVNVSASSNVMDSTYVNGCLNISNSQNIVDSTNIMNSVNVDNSKFCYQCRDINHSLFCVGLNDVDYYLFNKPIPEKTYYFIVDQLKSLFLIPQLKFVTEWADEWFGQEINVNTDLRSYYSSYNKKFVEWARSLPGYAPVLFDVITLYNKKLQNS